MVKLTIMVKVKVRMELNNEVNADKIIKGKVEVEINSTPRAM